MNIDTSMGYTLILVTVTIKNRNYHDLTQRYHHVRISSNILTVTFPKQTFSNKPLCGNNQLSV